jgi:hypothetical protein
MSAKYIKVPFHTIKTWFNRIYRCKKHDDLLRTLKPSLIKRTWVPIEYDLQEPDAVRLIEIEADLKVEDPQMINSNQPITGTQTMAAPIRQPIPEPTRQPISVPMNTMEKLRQIARGTIVIDNSLDDLYQKSVGAPEKLNEQPIRTNNEFNEKKINELQEEVSMLRKTVTQNHTETQETLKRMKEILSWTVDQINKIFGAGA